MGGQRADLDSVPINTNASQLGDSVQIDQYRRRGQSKLERRDQRMPPGQKLAAIRIGLKAFDRAGERLGADIFESGGDHG